jgi:hypothetical protein
MNKLIQFTTHLSNKVMQLPDVIKSMVPSTPEGDKRPVEMTVVYSIFTNQQEDEDNESTLYTPQLA